MQIRLAQTRLASWGRTRHHARWGNSPVHQVGLTHPRSLAILLLLTFIALPAHALRLQLRARTRMEVAVVPVGAELEVRGALQDSRAQPVANAQVAVTVVGSPPPAERHLKREEAQTTTGADGHFAVRVPLKN